MEPEEFVLGLLIIMLLLGAAWGMSLGVIGGTT